MVNIIKYLPLLCIKWSSNLICSQRVIFCIKSYQVLSVSGLVGHFVQTWPDSECSHTVQFLDSAVLRTFFSSGLTCFGTVWPFWCWCAVQLWYNQNQCDSVTQSSLCWTWSFWDSSSDKEYEQSSRKEQGKYTSAVINERICLMPLQSALWRNVFVLSKNVN